MGFCAVAYLMADLAGEKKNSVESKWNVQAEAVPPKHPSIPGNVAITWTSKKLCFNNVYAQCVQDKNKAVVCKDLNLKHTKPTKSHSL